MKKRYVIALALCIATSTLFAEADKTETQSAQKPYSENSVIVKKPATPTAKTKAAYVEDRTASEGMAAFQTGKSGWGVQWYTQTFAPKLKPDVEYVFKMRLRPEFNDAPDIGGFFLILGFYNMKTKKGRGAFKVPFKAYDDGKYRDVFLFRTKIKDPEALEGYFFCAPNAKLMDGDFKVWYDHIEFIPTEEFKDKGKLAKLKLFSLY